MRRRAFLGAIGATAAWPVAARAQQVMPVVGFLRTTSGAVSRPHVASFRQGLKEAGFVEGQNIVVEYRYADNRPDLLPLLVGELIHHKTAVIAANTSAALVAKSVTTIPIVFGGGGDPVKEGLVASLNKPGGNITGVTFLAGQLAAKRLELLRRLVPKATAVGVLVNPDTAETEAEQKDVQNAAQTVGQQLIIADVRTDGDIAQAFATFIQRGANALLVGTGSFLFSYRERITALAARHGLPASYSLREFPEVGGLMSYGTSITDAYRQMGVYTGRIVKGEKPGDLPVVQSAKFEFVINLKTAKTLGLEIHPQLLATADEVIE